MMVRDWIWIILMVVLLVLAGSIAQAHKVCREDRPDLCQEYDRVCCDEKDCAPLPEEQVELTREGYRVTIEGMKPILIPYGEHLWSTDGRYHICVFQPGPTGVPSPFIRRRDGKPCFYAPPPGT